MRASVRVRAAAGVVAMAILLLVSPRTWADADSLLEDFGDILKMYYLYSASDGMTHVVEMPVPAARTPSALLTYFDEPVQKFTIGYYRDGQTADFHYAGHRNLLIYLQGTQVITTGDGKEYLLKPGMVALAEDWTGKGHTYRCVAKTKKKVCLLLQVTLGELPRELPLREPPPTTQPGTLPTGGAPPTTSSGTPR